MEWFGKVLYAIEGDVKAQQAIRFNIFQLNQTYTGKMQGSTLDQNLQERNMVEALTGIPKPSLPFYTATKNQSVARNLLNTYLQLDKAIENAKKLGFKNRLLSTPWCHERRRMPQRVGNHL